VKSEAARSITKLVNDSQPGRARTNRVSRATQQKLDKLHDQRKDLFARVVSGELTAHGACPPPHRGKPQAPR
jgi:hypothetical protein